MDFSKELDARLASIESKLIATKDVLTFDEVAAYTGLSKSYLYKLTSNRQIPHYKPFGKLVYFNRLEIQEWLQSKAVATSKELDGVAANYLTLKHRAGKR